MDAVPSAIERYDLKLINPLDRNKFKQFKR